MPQKHRKYAEFRGQATPSTATDRPPEAGAAVRICLGARSAKGRNGKAVLFCEIVVRLSVRSVRDRNLEVDEDSQERENPHGHIATDRQQDKRDENS